MRCAALALPALLAGCALTPPPHGYVDGALPLSWSRAHVDTVNCKRGDCERWFLLTPPGKGDVSVSVRSIARESDPPAFVVQLVESGGGSLARQTNLGDTTVSLEHGVFADRYLVSVASAPGVGEFDFTISAGFDAAVLVPAAKPEPEPEPLFVMHTSQVLESEGYGQDATAVFIESGTRHGMEIGYSGRLIDDGVEIGRVVIEQVFPDGSKARVEGFLAQPVTHETIAEIQMPADRVVKDPEAPQSQEDGSVDP